MASTRHTSRRRNGHANGSEPQDPLRFAVIGLGYIAQNAVLPAFRHAQRSCVLTGLVSGDPAKRRTLGKRYAVADTWDYEDFDRALASDVFDAVYISLPNHLHHEFAVRAARAGKHVLCEKPMALSVRDCSEMIAAARENRVKLMIAYRLHLDTANLRAVEIARSGELGELQGFVSSFGTPVRAGNIRLRRDTGGGTLWDIGIYCVNAARYLFQSEPLEVFAWATRGDAPRFREVEETTAATLRFPGGRLATFWTSFSSTDIAHYTLVGTKGCLALDGAYEYHEPRELCVTVDDRDQTRTYAVRDQFAAELVYFADCVANDREPVPSGVEGRTDVAIIRALYESIRTGRPVALDLQGPTRRPRPSMAIERPPVRREPELVRVAAPHPS